MYLERLSVQGVSPESGPNKYFKPEGQFNKSSQYADINLPNCTTYCYCRAFEAMEATEVFPGVRAGGGYGNAKTWYDTTLFAKGKEIITGSIAVFDGNAGHVVFIERKIDATHALISESNYDSNKSRRDWKYWQKRVVELIPGKATLAGVGKLKGFIYVPVKNMAVSFDPDKEQIEVKGEFINMRSEPSMSGQKYTGTYCPVGCYNVVDKTEADGYTWYKLENQYWIAGVSEVVYHEGKKEEWVEPEAVAEDLYKDQVYINTNGTVRMREDSTTSSAIVGECIPHAYYNILGKADKSDYTWYQVGTKAFIAGIPDIVEFKAAKVDEDIDEPIEEPVFELPQPAKEDSSVDQIYINNDNGQVRIRKTPGGDIIGAVINHAYYNVLDKSVESDYTWYNIGTDAWVAGVPQVEFKAAEKWVAPEAVKEDTTKDQIFVNNTKGQIRIRKAPSMAGEIMGFVENLAYYNVIDKKNADGYIWYCLGKDAWVAGITEIEFRAGKQPTPWVEPVPVAKNTKVDQIYVSNVVNIRKEASTKSEAMGTCKLDSYYNVLEIKKTSAYVWYKIGDEAYVANVEGISFREASNLPSPVEEDITKDQIFVGDILLNIRKEPSTSADKIGACQDNSNYNVLEVKEANGYTWYKLDEGAWAAQVSGVIYYPAGSSRKGPELKKEIPALQTALDIALKCVEKNQVADKYDELYEKVEDLKKFINANFDPFDYDYVDEHEYDEIDLLYTADTHGAWVGYDEDGNYLSPVFNFDDLSNYRNKLKKNNVKALLVDCGDWSRPCRVYDDYVNTGRMISAEQMNEKEYLAVTYGNHEWKWGDDAETIKILNKQNNMTACNMFKNGKLVYKPYRTAKIGSKRIGVIGVGYPSPNGQGNYYDGEWSYGDYVFYDDHKLFAQVQKYIDELKANGFDYIVVISHMCKSTYESDSRYKARTDSLIRNTKGLTAVLQGHYNFATNAESITDASGKTVLLAHEAGANMNNFGRLQLKGNKVSSYLLDERSDLNVI